MKRLLLLVCLGLFGCTPHINPTMAFQDVVNQYGFLTNSCFNGSAEHIFINVIKTNLVGIPYMAEVRYSEGFRTSTSGTVSVSLKATFSYRGEKWAEKTVAFVDQSRVGTNDLDNLYPVLDCEERQWQEAVMLSNLPHIR